MNERGIVQDNSIKNVGEGWYSTRRRYRSVAFGTWKVGAARDLCIKRGISEDGRQLARLVKFNLITKIFFCTNLFVFFLVDYLVYLTDLHFNFKFH